MSGVWTVGQLRAALEPLADDTPLELFTRDEKWGVDAPADGMTVVVEATSDGSVRVVLHEEPRI